VFLTLKARLVITGSVHATIAITAAQKIMKVDKQSADDERVSIQMRVTFTFAFRMSLGNCHEIGLSHFA
jgi:alpha-D-ribose 1-methylphosphonate 5-phosphate C-P lyase